MDTDIEDFEEYFSEEEFNSAFDRVRRQDALFEKSLERNARIRPEEQGFFDWLLEGNPDEKTIADLFASIKE